MDNEQLVTSIKVLCKANDITVTKLEEVLGMSQGLISRWNKSDPSLSKIIDIANYFKISVDTLINSKKILNDKFLCKLLADTTRRKLIWHPYDDEITVPKKHSDPDAPKIYRDFPPSGGVSVLNGVETSFYTCINNGYISLYSFHSQNNTQKNAIILLYIQPEPDSNLIQQSYQTDDLKDLWQNVLLNLDENAPDDIKAEKLKFSYISDIENEFESTSKNTNIKDVLNNQSLAEVNRLVKTPEFQEVQKLFSNPEFQKVIEIAQKTIINQ